MKTLALVCLLVFPCWTAASDARAKARGRAAFAYACAYQSCPAAADAAPVTDRSPCKCAVGTCTQGTCATNNCPAGTCPHAAAAKSCPCSGQCACGCNTGQACQCGNAPAATTTPAPAPQYQPAVQQPVYYFRGGMTVGGSCSGGR